MTKSWVIIVGVLIVLFGVLLVATYTLPFQTCIGGFSTTTFTENNGSLRTYVFASTPVCSAPYPLSAAVLISTMVVGLAVMFQGFRKDVPKLKLTRVNREKFYFPCPDG